MKKWFWLRGVETISAVFEMKNVVVLMATKLAGKFCEKRSKFGYEIVHFIKKINFI